MPGKHELFTDRADAVELFHLLRSTYRPDQPTPILNYVAPVGSGKSALVDYLRDKKCDHLPHIQFDLSLTSVPKDVLFLLVEIRNRLRKRKDEQDHHLTFPRFDLGAALALAALEASDTHRLSEGEIRTNLSRAASTFDEWYDSAAELATIVQPIPLILAAIRASLKFDLVNQFLLRLEQGSTLAWYRSQYERLRIPSNASVDRILRRLDDMSTPGESDRVTLIEEILPEALLADLNEGLGGNAKAWKQASCAVAFLNDFEVLMNDPARTGKRLLEALTRNAFVRQGGANRLLLVVASQLPISGHALQEDENIPPEPVLSAQQHAQETYQNWLASLPYDREEWRLWHLLIQVPLPNFDLADTRSYLQRFGTLYKTQAFQKEALITSIYRVTQGQPLYLSLVASAISEAGPTYGDIDLMGLELDGTPIVDSLLDIYLQQLSPAERKPLIWSALPREFEKDTLRTILHADDVETDRLWSIYLHLPFIRIHRGRLVIQPLVRTLLRQKVPPTRDPKRDYVHIHTLLRDYFHTLAIHDPENERARIEEVYHTLALGDPEPAVALGIYAQQHDQAYWSPLLNVVAQSPSGPMGDEITRVRQQAEEALERSKNTQIDTTEESIRAIVLFQWLLSTPTLDRYQELILWQHLADAFNYLKSGDRLAHKEASIAAQHQSLLIAQSLLDPTLQAQPPSTSITSVTPIPQAQPLPSEASTNLPPPPPSPGSAQPVPLLTMLSNSHLGKQLQALTHSAARPLRRAQLFLQSLPNAVRIIIIIEVVLLLLGTGFSVVLLRPAPTAGPLARSIQPQMFLTDQNGIGVTMVANQSQYVGLSDGSIPFDISDRPDHDLKVQAAIAFHQHQVATAERLWNNAATVDTNDAEVDIYLANQQVAQSCVYMVVATDLSGISDTSVTTGRDDLQGAYLVQEQQNTTPGSMKLCLLIANMGDDPSYANSIVAPQIVRASHHLPIKAVMGWPSVTGDSSAISVLGQAHIPVVSPANYDSSDTASNLFHITLSNELEGGKDALYAENQLRPRSIVSFYDSDLADTYSSGLERGFEQQLEQDNQSTLLVDRIPYTSCHAITGGANCKQQFQSLVTRASHLSPDLIFFAGNAEDSNALLANLTTSQATFPTDLRVLGGDELYQLVGYSSFERPNFQYLDFTAFAYPDTDSVAQMKQEYSKAFDKGDTTPPTNSYGYSRPDNDAICAYDAMGTLAQAISTFAASDRTFQPGDLLRSLTKLQAPLIGTNQTQYLPFNEFHQVTNMSVVVLRVNPDGYITFIRTV